MTIYVNIFMCCIRIIVLLPGFSHCYTFSTEKHITNHTTVFLYFSMWISILTTTLKNLNDCIILSYVIYIADVKFTELNVL